MRRPYAVENAVPEDFVSCLTRAQYVRCRCRLRVYALCPIVGLDHQSEHGGGRGILDTNGSDLDTEEPDSFLRVLIQPVERCAVFITKSGRAPHDRRRISAAGVGQQLAQMAVVRHFQLVLDNDGGSRLQIRADEIQGKVAYPPLRFDQFQVHAEHVRKNIGVLKQPLREMVSLMSPYLSRRHRDDSAQLR